MTPQWSRRAAAGVAALALRDGLARLVALAGHLVLARVLAPADFGAWAVVLLLASLAELVAGLGLGAALVQRPAPPDEHVAGTALVLRLGAALCMAVILVAAVIALSPLFRLPSTAPMLALIVAPSLILTALALLPEAHLERALRFDRLALADSARVVAGQMVAVALVWAGTGVMALAGGYLAGALVWVVALWALAPGRPRLAWRYRATEARRLLGFGGSLVGYQIVHLAKDQMAPALGAPLFGSTAVGYLDWAGKLARGAAFPAALADRVAFPAYARLQHDPAALRRALPLTLRWSALLSFPLLAVLGGLGPALIHYLYTDQWLPALPALYLLALQAAIGVLPHVLMPVLLATGRVRPVLLLSVGWMALAWALALALSPLLGYLGIAVAHVLSTAIAAGVLLRLVPVPVGDALRAVGPAAGGAVLAVVAARGAAAGLGDSIPATLAALGLGLVVYALVVLVVQGHTLWRDWRSF
ncbi:MAG: oligosaccharide flippase family protein [Chloroflexi bacterium]|nr:oligosaccharide flippase family protein [Chloroflexota bacterium]MBU1747499.1 oligosaccharide flippase family protein [Chloroflexota bacterium]MBU1878047.1 oligosaccharide flippase family protein [Chloroflexota bacterium]